jgi:Arc/MetJ-type ribon-helix-helix transcriptional regulator
MPMLTLKVPSEMAARLEGLAARRRVSKSTVVREALEEKLRKSTNVASLHDVMKHSIGVLDSGIRDLGHNPKHMAGFGRK